MAEARRDDRRGDDPRRAELIAALMAARARPDQPELTRKATPYGVLGSAQRRFWVSEQLSENSAGNTVTLVLEAEAAIDLGRLTSAVRALLERYPVLRTRIDVAPDGSPLPVEVPAGQFPCSAARPSADGRDDGPRDWYLRVAAASQQYGTSLRNGPLVAVTLARWSQGANAVVVSIAHGVTDAFSNTVLLDDLCRLYDGRPVGSPPPSYTAAAEAEARSRARRSTAVRRDVAYLAGAPLGARMPFGSGGAVVCHNTVMSAAATERIRRLGRSEGATGFMVLLGVIAERLAIAVAADDLVIGMSVDTREELGMPGAVGPWLDATAFRLTTTGSESGWARVVAAVRSARDRVYEVLDQGVGPYQEVLAGLRGGRDEGVDRIFDVIVNHDWGERPEFSLAGAPARLLDTPITASEMALTVSVGMANGAWRLSAVGRGEESRAFCRWLGESVAAALEQREALTVAATPAPARRSGPGAARRSAAGNRTVAAEEVTRRLRDCWEQVLGRAVSAEANVFSLGADSLSIARFCASAQRQGIEVLVGDVMRSPAVALLVENGLYRVTADAAGQRRDGTGGQGSRVAPPRTSMPLTQGQLGMVYATERHTAQRLYCSVIHAECRGEWRAAALHQAVESVAASHPILRTAYGLTGRVPTQRWYDSVPIHVDVRHAETLPAEQQAAILASAIDEARARRYDWFTPPLAAFTAIAWGEQRFALVIACHHSILDGQSERLLVDDLLGAYESALSGTPDIAVLGTHYGEYVDAELRALESAAQLAYWRDEVRHIRRAADAARAVARAAAPAGAGCSWQLAAATARGLRTAAMAHGWPLKTLLIAAHCAALSRLLGVPEVVTGLSAHNRLAVPDGDRVLGNFVNMVPFRIRVGDAWQETARAAYEQESSLTEFSRVPLATIVRAGDGTRPFWNSISYTRFGDARPTAAERRVFAESVTSTMLSEDALHVNFDETTDGTLDIRIRLGPGCPADGEVDAYRRFLDAAMRSVRP